MHSLVRKSSFSKAKGLHETGPSCVDLRASALTETCIRTYVYSHVYVYRTTCTQNVYGLKNVFALIKFSGGGWRLKKILITTSIL